MNGARLTLQFIELWKRIEIKRGHPGGCHCCYVKALEQVAR